MRRPVDDRLLQLPPFLPQDVDMGEHDHPVLNSQAEKGNEAHCGRDIEAHPPHHQCQHAAENHQRQQGNQQPGLPEVAEGEKQQQEHHGEGHRHYQRQTAESAVLVLELTAPGIMEIAMVVEDIAAYLPVSLGHERREVAVAEIDLYGRDAPVHLPRDHAGSYGSTHICH